MRPISIIFIVILFMTSCAIKKQYLLSGGVLSELKTRNDLTEISERRSLNTDPTHKDSENIKSGIGNSTSIDQKITKNTKQNIFKKSLLNTYGLRDTIPKSKIIQKGKDKKDSDFWDTLSAIGWYLFVLALFFLCGLLLKLLFPKLSLLAACLLAIPALIVFILIVGIIYVLAGGRVH